MWVRLGHQDYESILTAPTEKENYPQKRELWGTVIRVYSVCWGTPAQGRDRKFIFVLLQPMENTKFNCPYSYWNYEIIPKAIYFLKGIVISNVDSHE